MAEATVTPFSQEPIAPRAQRRRVFGRSRDALAVILRNGRQCHGAGRPLDGFGASGRNKNEQSQEA